MNWYCEATKQFQLHKCSGSEVPQNGQLIFVDISCLENCVVPSSNIFSLELWDMEVK